MKSFKLLFLITVLFSSTSFSAPTDGQFIAKCLGCHGRSGVSGYTDFPNLAGLNQSYLWNQLKAFQSKNRVDTTMNVMPYMVEGLSETDLYGLADVFSRLPKEVVKKTDMTEEELQLFIKGQTLINGNTTTCRFCHLGNSTGDGPAVPIYPDLVSQQQGYLTNQIRAFRDKKRWNPIMNSDLVSGLSDQDIVAISVYFRYLKAK